MRAATPELLRAYVNVDLISVAEVTAGLDGLQLCSI